VQIELKTSESVRAGHWSRSVDTKNDPGNGYTKTLLCFLQLCHRSVTAPDTWNFANNNTHFASTATSAIFPSTSRRGGQQEDHPPRQLSRTFLRQVHPEPE